MPSELSFGTDPWSAGEPVTMATVAGRYCLALAERPLSTLDLSQLRAHSGLVVGAEKNQVRPALLARIWSPEGQPIGTVVRLLSPDAPYDRPPLLRPVRWWGERRGGSVLIAPPPKRQRRWRNVITLATTFDMAIALAGLHHPSQHLAAIGLDHLAECDLPAECKVVIVVPRGAGAEPDSRLLVDLAIKRFRRSRPATDIRVEEWPQAAIATKAS